MTLQHIAYAFLIITAALALVAPLQWANHAACLVVVLLGSLVVRES